VNDPPREKNLVLDDEPEGRYVTQEYHDNQIATGKQQLDRLDKWVGELKAANVELEDWNNQLVPALDNANTKVRSYTEANLRQAKKIERLTSEIPFVDTIDKQKVDISNLRNKLNDSMNLSLNLKAKIDVLEDKVAGYELGFTPKEVAAEVPAKRGRPKKTATTKTKAYSTKLTDEQVWDIRRHHANGKSNSWIAHRGRHLIAVVYKVIRGQTYTNVGPDTRPTPKGRAHAGHEGEVLA